MSADRGHLVLDLLPGGGEGVRPFVDAARAVGSLPRAALPVGQDVGDGLGQGRLLSHHQHGPHPVVWKTQGGRFSTNAYMCFRYYIFSVNIKKI